MADIFVRFTGSPARVGLIVRGKLSASHHPDLMAQHADAILSDGSPVGFYGEGYGGSSNQVGMGMQGVVYGYQDMRINRPFYVDADNAVANRVVSTVLLVQVTSAQATAFDANWAQMTQHPGSFNIVGGNCSTHASAAFIAAGILADGIPGLDTPDRLYAQIVKKLPAASLQTMSGFVGFAPAPGGGFTLRVVPYVDTPALNRPNPGRGGSLGSRAAA
jgi:hypothetical protein